MKRDADPAIHNKNAIQRLRIHLTVFGWVTLLFTLAAASIIDKIWSSEYALRWTIISGVVLIYQLVFSARRINLNHKLCESELLPVFGLGSTLSLLRGVFFAWTAGFLFSPRPDSNLSWAPAVLYTVGLVLDLGDGYVARLKNQATKLGASLDTELDALGLLIAVSLAVWYQTLPLWFLPVGAARYAFIFGIWLRERQDLTVYPLPPSTSRRPIAGLTMGFTSAMLWPIISPPGSTIAGVTFLIPFTASFTRDWLVVSGALDPKNSLYLELRDNARSILLNWLPLVLRFSLVLLAGALIVQWVSAADDPYANSPIPYALAVLLLTGGTIMIALGIAGRITAVILIFPVGFAILEAGLEPLLTILLLIILAILLLGTGTYSLWEPEKILFGHHWGERQV